MLQATIHNNQELFQLIQQTFKKKRSPIIISILKQLAILPICYNESK